MQVEIPEESSPEFDEFVKNAVAARYPKMVADGVSDREMESLLGVGAKWVKAVATAAQS